MAMVDLSYSLSVLARAVAFRNLSAAASHVGLSQPQLSRVVARLERELGLELLNRQVRRRSYWTPQALQLAETFDRSHRRLEASIRALQSRQMPKQIHFGTL